MRWFVTWLIFGVCCSGPNGALAQLQLVAEQRPQTVFSGRAQNLSLGWRNPGSATSETDIQTRVMQLTSATAVRVQQAPWKRLQVLPGQTVLETATLEFPTVRAETRFLVQWFDGNSNVLGSTEVLAYPANLLAELAALAGRDDGDLGVFDPQNQLKSLLKNASVQFVDLENTELENFRGKLAIIGPFASKAQMGEALAGKIKTIARAGVAVVWMQPPPEPSTIRRQMEKLQPSFYSVPENRIAVVVVQPDLVAGLSENPRAQLNLVYFCKLALNPQPPVLPDLDPQIQ